MNKLIGVLLSATFLCLGVIIGFLFAPVKKGVYCGNNNGNNYIGTNKDEDKAEYVEQDEDDLAF